MARIPLELLSSKKFVVLLEVEGNWRRIINLRFERGRNGLGYQVDLPHFAHSQGVLRKFAIDGPPGAEVRVDLEAGGTTTSHLLKYSHHADGRAHFSQDGRGITQIMTRTGRLGSTYGHLFSVNYWGADAFALYKTRDARVAPPRTSPLFIDTAADQRPAEELSGRLIGESYPLRHLSIDPALARNGDWSRAIVFRRGDGSFGQGIVALPPDPTPNDYLIMLSHISMGRTGAEGTTSLVFSGGFHAPRGGDGPLSAIALSYQNRDSAVWERTVEMIGSSDYRPADGLTETLSIVDQA